MAVAPIAGVVACSSSPRGADKPSAGAYTPPSDISSNQRFNGDPGTGSLYFGRSIPFDSPVKVYQDGNVGRVTMSRRFFRPAQEQTLLSMASLDRAAGVLPFVSLKPPWTWASLASGAHDDWITSLLSGLAMSDLPVMLAVHHEPENDVTTSQTPAAWVAMQRRLITIARKSAPSVTVVPTLMQFTFNPSSGRDPEEWLVPDAVLQGVDVYNPWTPSGGASWVEFSTMLDRVRSVTGPTPVVVPEYGCHTDHDDLGRTRRWFEDAFDYATSHDVVGLAYFDSPFGSTGDSWRVDQTGQDALTSLSQRPPVIGLRG